MRHYTLKLLVVGDAATGKEAIIQRFTKGTFKAHLTHISAFDMFTKDIYVNNEEDRLTLSIWKIGGHNRFKFFRQDFYRGALGAMIVFDLTRYETFNPNIVNWIREVWTVTGRIPIILVGSKSDMSDQRKVRAIDAKNYADRIPCEYIETSAKDGEGINECFSVLGNNMLNFYKKYYVAKY